MEGATILFKTSQLREARENLSDYAAIGCSLECDCLKGRCKSLDQSHWEVKAISDYLQLLIENNFSLS